MNFNNLLKTCLLPCLLLGVTACSSSSDPLPDITETTVYSGKKLRLTYCGEQMPAKIVTVVPEDSHCFTFTAQGITDLSMLSSMGLSGTGPAPGVLPGSPRLVIPVTTTAQGAKYVFTGNGVTDFCDNYSYSGFLEGDSLILNLDNVVLSKDYLSGTIWTPVPFKQDGLKVESTPFHLLWSLDPAEGVDIDLTGLLNALVSLPIIPVYQDTAYSSIAQLLSMSLQTVAFNQNGNIFVRYFSSVGGATQLVTSIGNTLQYMVLGDSCIKIYPNPTTLFGRWLVAHSNSSSIPDISFTKSGASEESDSKLMEALVPVIKSLLPSLLEMTCEGIPLEINKTDSTLVVYMNTELILSLLQKIAEAFAENPESLTTLLGLSTDNPTIGDILPQLQKLLLQIDAVLKATTKIEIGLSFNKYVP